MLARWRQWHETESWRRRLLKSCLLLVVVGLCLFPRFWLVPALVSRSLNLEGLLQPDHPGLAPLETAVRARIGQQDAPRERDTFKAVESVVLEHIPYAFDWETWGQMEYLPTLDEVLGAGREDCDGRAVVMASLLRRMGFEAHLATDFLHMWVVGPKQLQAGSLGGEPSLVATSRGTRVSWATPRLAANFVRGLGFGIAVFPWTREAILVCAALLLTLHPRVSVLRATIGVLLVLATWISCRWIGQRLWVLGDAALIVGCFIGWCLLAWPGRKPDVHQA